MNQEGDYIVLPKYRQLLNYVKFPLYKQLDAMDCGPTCRLNPTIDFMIKNTNKKQF